MSVSTITSSIRLKRMEFPLACYTDHCAYRGGGPSHGIKKKNSLSAPQVVFFSDLNQSYYRLSIRLQAFYSVLLMVDRTPITLSIPCPFNSIFNASLNTPSSFIYSLARSKPVEL